MSEIEIKIRTLTPLWTGDVNRECKSIKETGIIGSLRWWYEALVRGLGGYACDPTLDRKCELKQDKFNKAIKSGKSIQGALDEQICPACQLFGCTGCRKRFRLETVGLNDDDFIQGRGQKSGLKAGKEISLKFTLLSEIRPEEKWLFKITLWIIENYGAVGGRTTWKPNSSWGTDYGLIKISDYNGIQKWDSESTKEEVLNWLKNNREKLRKENNDQWFNFELYWIIEGQYLNKDQMNNLLKLVRVNTKRVIPQKGTENDEFLNFLRGKQGESKKIFSFDAKYNNPKPFVFGYVRNDEELGRIKEKLRDVGINIDNLKTGEEIMGGLK